MWIINLWKDNGTGYNPPILLFIKNNTPEIARNPLLTEIKNRFLFWRSGRDSNPRVVSHKLISSFIAVCYLHGFSCQFQSALYAHKPA